MKAQITRRWRLYCTECGRWTWTSHANDVMTPRPAAHIPNVAYLCETCFRKVNNLTK